MKLNRTLSIILAILLIFGFTSSLHLIPSGKAVPGGTIYVTPKYNNFTSPPTSVGTWFTINVRIANYANVAGWQIKLAYDKSVLYTSDKNITYASDHIFPVGTYPAIPSAVGDLNSTHSYALMTTTTYGAVEYSGTDAGLMTVKFKILKAPSKALLWLEPVDTWIIDENIEELPETLINGYFEIRLPTPPPAKITPEPQKVVNASLTPSNNFTININIKDAQYLQSFQFKLNYNPTALHATSAQLGNFFPPGITPTIQIDNTAGYIKIAASLRLADPPASGNGTLASIKFHVEALGESNLAFSETVLRDPLGYSLPCTTTDGYFNNMLIPKLAVDPPEIADPTLVPPQTFTINITITEIQDLYYYEFKLKYDPNVLVGISLQINSVLNEVNYDPYFSINNTVGMVWVKVEYYAPAVPIGTMAPIALVTLAFRVRDVGISALDLFDTVLKNSEGSPINHETYDGTFIPVIRDVAIIDITPHVSAAYQGHPVKINVTAMNKGNITETFNVNIYYGSSNLIGTLTFTNIAPDEQKTLTITWNTTGVACANYAIWAEATPVPYEDNLADNTLTDGMVRIKLVGDINGDGKVDGTDLYIWVLAFNSTPGSPRWNPEADLNRDSKVDGRDIALLIRNFGKAG